MKGKGDAQSQGGACGTQVGCPFRPQVAQMDIPPVVNVGHKKGRDHPKPFDRRELV